MYQCKSGRHWWLHADDAAKCCNGYKRILIVPQPGEHLPADARNIQHVAGTLTGHVWMSEQELQTDA